MQKEVGMAMPKSTQTRVVEMITNTILISLAHRGKESGKMPIQFLFSAPGSWCSNQIAECGLHHHFCKGIM